MNSGNGRADRFATSDKNNPDRPGVDSRWCRFIEVPEFIALVEVGMQLLDSPRPLIIVRLQPNRKPGLGDQVAFQTCPPEFSFHRQIFMI